MKLLVIVLGLLSERFLIHSLSYQRFHWFKNYYSWINHLGNYLLSGHPSIPITQPKMKTVGWQ